MNAPSLAATLRTIVDWADRRSDIIEPIASSMFEVRIGRWLEIDVSFDACVLRAGGVELRANRISEHGSVTHATILLVPSLQAKLIASYRSRPLTEEEQKAPLLELLDSTDGEIALEVEYHHWFSPPYADEELVLRTDAGVSRVPIATFARLQMASLDLRKFGEDTLWAQFFSTSIHVQRNGSTLHIWFERSPEAAPNTLGTTTLIWDES